MYHQGLRVERSEGIAVSRGIASADDEGIASAGHITAPDDIAGYIIVISTI
jgi:hypothetical protein